MKPTVPAEPHQSGWGCAAANRSTNTPLGISTASPPMCSTRVRRASSETATRAPIFSSAGSRTG